MADYANDVLVDTQWVQEHLNDENIRIVDLVAATKMMGRFMDAFARLPEVPRVP